MLEQYISEKKQARSPLLMTHIVIGYPSMEASYELVKEMVNAGVEMMELQIPFSEPIADGPVILNANQCSLASGTTVAQCLEFAARVAKDFKIPFLFMTYYNILFRYGVTKFVKAMKDAGLSGSIVPDLPYEEGKEYLDAMKAEGLDPIFIYTPTSTPERMRAIDAHAGGFIYCVARKGVTGQKTDFGAELSGYLGRCRETTKLPLAVGFGVKDRAEVENIGQFADIAVVGSQSIRVMEEKGAKAVGEFIRGLRA